MSENKNSDDQPSQAENDCTEKIVGICNQLALGVQFTTADIEISKFK